ncbi:hypothetical protein T492DRAFT_450079 [Pavlovales sp. CCMP2436]|nr:hypothetical protein T492DRAFT_450079 [Pavlovales sp. CCMP2436]
MKRAKLATKTTRLQALEELVFGDGRGWISPLPAESSARAPAPWHRASIEALDVSQCCLLRP